MIKPKQDNHHVARQDPYAYKVVCEDSQYTKPTTAHVGEDASQQHLHSMKIEFNTFWKRFNLSVNEIQKFASAEKCCICDEKCSIYDKHCERIVRHHNHLTGQFTGAAHNVCNNNCKQADFIPVVFHNLEC